MKKILLLLSIGMLTFSCEDQMASEEESNGVRMVIQETQCANPWEFSRDQEEYIDYIKSYLQNMGVSTSLVQILDELPPDTALCMACTCWSGNNIYITVPPAEVEKAEALGFSKAD